MEGSVVNKLAGEGTPIARNEKSTYFRRSFGPEIASTSNTPVSSMKSHGISNNSFSLLKPRNQLMSMRANTNATISTINSSFEAPLVMDITEDNSIGLLIGDVDPTVHASSLFQDFLDFYQCYSGEHEVFDLLLQYEEACSNKVKELINIISKSTPNEQKYNEVQEVLQALCNERNTWRLIRTLYYDRVFENNINEEAMLMDTLGQRLSDKELVQNLFKRDSFVRQCQLVVDWLEKNASDDLAYTHIDKLEYFSDHATSWEHTLHVLTRQRTSLDRPTRDSLITELDPDAPVRQRNNVLHVADKEDEVRLLKFMFIQVRAGNLEKAQKMAENFGQPWLAASLEGWRLFHDPNYGNEAIVGGDNLLPTEGNKYRDVWKVACWRMAQEPRISLYQQALFGILSGNLKAALRACVMWNDYLWAYTKVFVDQRIEQELRSNTQCGQVLDELPAEYWDKVLDFEQIFQELNACASPEVRKEGQGYHQVIQKYVILDDVDGLVETLYTWIKQDSRPSVNLLRIMTHIILFFRIISRCSKEELCIAIIEAYVKALIDQRKIPVVAYYVATLPATHQIVWYAKFLEGITDNSERELCLKYAEEAGLDIPLITKTVVESTRMKTYDQLLPSTITNTSTTEGDWQKINALDWLIFDQSQRAEAMKQANALMRVFVASEKLDAARQAFGKIPADSINVMMKQSKLCGQVEMKADDDNAIREYLCFKAYLEAYDAFNDWFHHFQHAKPKCPEPPAGSNVKFKEKVAYEHEMRQYELELERWENALMAQTKTTTDRLYNVLLFVSGGWMVDQRMDGPVDESRQKQMALLRKLCIPQITKLLHNVLYSAHLYKESVQLADIVASERHQLYKEFSVQELRQLMSSLRESSLVLLSQDLDPLGYPFEQSSENIS